MIQFTEERAVKVAMKYKHAALTLAKTLSGYAERLADSNNKQQKRHTRKEPCRQVD